MSKQEKTRKRSEEAVLENKKNRPSISGKINNSSSSESEESPETMGEQITSTNFDKVFINAFARALENTQITKKLTQTFAAECKAINDETTKRIEQTVNLVDVKTQINDARITAIEIELDAVEQDRRSHNLIIKGLTKTDNAKVSISSELKRRLDIKIKPEDIKYAIPIDQPQAEKPTDNKTSYKINFYEQKMRDLVYGNRMMLKGTKVFINEDLTIRKSKLAFEARQYVKTKPGANTWTQDGKIFLKLTPSSKPRAILSTADLENYDDTQDEATSLRNTPS